MNKIQIEEMLAKEGFTTHEVSAIRQHAEKGGYSYTWLLSQLKKRFIVAIILIAILLAGLIYTIHSGTQENLVSYLITLVACLAIFYTFIPLKLAYKAFKFLRKPSHIL
ncbi:hypothetical protein [Pantoea ananatis]|uniref:hypothetical protein n=1 Tax=Pantoea ananas TaxID=553 RepID=UPI00128ECADD|nr:hypothetical protein [Pantoea ananatis]USL59541.1 hypothetical protein IAQ00_07225 [Pantoea ananatis]